MAIPWLVLLKTVPWADVISNAPADRRWRPQAVEEGGRSPTAHREAETAKAHRG